MPKLKYFSPITTTHPAMANEFHPKKNLPLTAGDLTSGSSKPIWWRCKKEKSHEWQAAPVKRSRGDGCPFCSGMRVCKTNSLATVQPRAASMWHPKKNGACTANDVTCGSSMKAWWQCPIAKDHVWQASVSSVNSSHIAGSTGCPYCHGSKVSKSNSLATLYPELAREWHKQKNGDLRPSSVTSASSRKVWWNCPSGKQHHAYECRVSSRTSGTACPYCANHSVIASDNSLAATHPHLAAQWHSSLNNGVTPHELTAGSSKRIWWQCPEGADHVWKTTVTQRTGVGTGCPICSRRQVIRSTSFAARCPELLKEWDYDKNRELGVFPDCVGDGSAQKVWWKCEKKPKHAWQTTIAYRARGGGCPFCSGRKISDDNRFSTLFPALAAEWHHKKNGSVKATDVSFGSARKVWWQCSVSKLHEWEAAVYTRTKVSSPTGCPCCLGRQLAEDNCLSFKYPQIARNWHKTKNGKLTAKDVTPFSAHRVWWKCIDGHVWDATVRSVTQLWLKHGTNGCQRCNLKERSKNASKSLKGRHRVDRAIRKRENIEDYEYSKSIPDSTILRSD